jgi:hypothetical protein
MSSRRPALQRMTAVVYRVLEVTVMIVTYLVLAIILYKAVTWLF